MANTIIAVLALLLFSTIIIVYLLIRNRASDVPADSGLLVLQQHIENLNKNLQSSFSESVRNQQFGSTQMSNAVRDVTERMVKLEETNKQILSFSGQLENLQRILTNPKQRGVLGEYYLETLLKNTFAPNQYQMQYKFKDGVIVDAVLFVQDRIIPIDSKFSLENYNRLVDEESQEERNRLEKLFLNDMKARILETKKYIKPEEGTMDFAFMFIPHEALYYDLLVNKIGAITSETESLLQRAAATYHVIIVSPTSFAAYLQTVLMGLNELKISEQSKEIRLRVQDLGRHLKAYEQYFQNIGKHLGTTVNQYNLAGKELLKIDKDVLKISGTEIGIESQIIDKPNDDITAS